MAPITALSIPSEASTDATFSAASMVRVARVLGLFTPLFLFLARSGIHLFELLRELEGLYHPFDRCEACDARELFSPERVVAPARPLPVEAASLVGCVTHIQGVYLPSPYPLPLPLPLPILLPLQGSPATMGLEEKP